MKFTRADGTDPRGEGHKKGRRTCRRPFISRRQRRDGRSPAIAIPPIVARAAVRIGATNDAAGTVVGWSISCRVSAVVCGSIAIAVTRLVPAAVISRGIPAAVAVPWTAITIPGAIGVSVPTLCRQSPRQRLARRQDLDPSHRPSRHPSIRLGQVMGSPRRLRRWWQR